MKPTSVPQLASLPAARKISFSPPASPTASSPQILHSYPGFSKALPQTSSASPTPTHRRAFARLAAHAQSRFALAVTAGAKRGRSRSSTRFRAPNSSGRSEAAAAGYRARTRADSVAELSESEVYALEAAEAEVVDADDTLYAADEDTDPATAVPNNATVASKPEYGEAPYFHAPLTVPPALTTSLTQHRRKPGPFCGRNDRGRIPRSPPRRCPSRYLPTHRSHPRRRRRLHGAESQSSPPPKPHPSSSSRPPPHTLCGAPPYFLSVRDKASLPDAERAASDQATEAFLRIDDGLGYLDAPAPRADRQYSRWLLVGTQGHLWLNCVQGISWPTQSPAAS